MKRAIVTGATGFIGSAFTKFLIDKGVEVLALGRRPLDEVSDSRRRKIERATYLCLDMKRIEELEVRLQSLRWDVGDDCVFFNLAWGGVEGLSDLNIEAQLKNVIWCVKAFEQAAQLGCKRFIQVGTMEEAFTYRYLKLDHNQHTQYNRHVIYSVAKIAAKQALAVRALSSDMEYIYVLHSHVMGEDDDKDSFLQVTLQKLVQGEDLIFSSGEQVFDVISLDDCALGYFLICEKGVPGEEYWVGSGNPCRLRDYVERMFDLFPSAKEMQFGTLPYNDIILSEDDFSIANLVRDTGYKPVKSYEQTVKDLHESLFN